MLGDVLFPFWSCGVLFERRKAMAYGGSNRAGQVFPGLPGLKIYKLPLPYLSLTSKAILQINHAQRRDYFHCNTQEVPWERKSSWWFLVHPRHEVIQSVTRSSQIERERERERRAIWAEIGKLLGLSSVQCLYASNNRLMVMRNLCVCVLLWIG